MNAIIFEDEKLSADHLINLIRRVDPSINVIAVADTVRKGIEILKSNVSADLLFVDVHLADGLSFEIFEQVHTEIPVIFTTAYDEYALKAFSLNSIDYLLKPVGIGELTAALAKMKKLRTLGPPLMIDNILQAYRDISRQYKSRFMVRMGENIFPVLAGDIVHFISDDPLVLLVSKQAGRYPVDYTLDQLETLLDPMQFFRINRKVILNIDSVAKAGNYFNSRMKVSAMHLPDDAAIVSRERVGGFKEWLGR